jgi:iron complex outermembrane receptor protein
MKNFKQKRSLFALAPVAAGCAVLLVSTSSAYAQQTSQNLNSVTVTGIRKGIEDAISVKKNSDAIVESISAEDIGKLPDSTIAESLARLPGVTTQRTKAGAASTISIRGLGPDFNGYMLNGREQTSTGDSRAVDLSVYPSELIGGATVYKTTDASLMTAGLAGTIDNKLIDPLAFPSRVLFASYQKTRNGIGLEGTPEGTSNRKSLTYIDQFADRTIGIALGMVRVDGTSNETGTGGWGSAKVNATLPNGTVVPDTEIPGPWGSGLDYRSQINTDKRDGIAAIIAYQPNKNFRSQLDLFYAKADNIQKKNIVKAGLGGPITNATIVNGVATKGTFQLAAGPNGLIDYVESVFDNDENKSIGWKNTLNMGNGWKASLDLNVNSANRVERDIEAYGGIPGADTLTFDNTSGSVKFTPGNPLAYTDPNIIKIRDQSGWSSINGVPQHGYSKGPTIQDKVEGLRLDFTKEMPEGSMFTDIQFGGNLTTRTKDRTTDEGLIVSTTGGGLDPIAFPSGSYVTENVGNLGLNFLTFDPVANLWPGATILRKYNDDILSKSWSVKEKVLTGYVKMNLDTTVSSVPVRGNVGVQVVNTDQSSLGFRAGIGSGVVLTNPAAGGLTSAGTSYTDVLPSLNLSGDLGSGSVLRFGIAQQIARATMTDMRNSLAVNLDTNAGNIATFGKLVGSAGNPELKPFKAMALDISYEKYFGTKAYFSAAAFYKKLDTYITPGTNTAYDFKAAASQVGLPIPPAGSIGTFTTTVNGNGGDLKGIELAVSAPFNLVIPMLDGFGLSGSFSTTESSVNLPNLTGLNPNQQVPTTGETIPLPGLSKDNSKLTLYYEKNGFSAFIATNRRSTYVGSVANDSIGGYPTLRFIEGSTWVSAQFGYEFQEGPAKGLSIRVEGNNLNKPVYRQLNVDGSEQSKTETGASIAFKVSYKLQ